MQNMKIVGVIASANENGNSATLLREALRGAKEAQAEVSEIVLSRSRIEYCRGCLGCMQNGQCFQKDDFTAVREALRDADGIILSTPTYAAAPSARMKNLIDRLGLFEYMTGEVFGGKYVAAIATAKSFGARQTVDYLAQVVLGGVFAKARVTGRLGAVLRGGKNACESPELLAKARHLGRKMVADFRRRRAFPWQNFFSRQLNDRVMRPMIAKGIVKHSDNGMRGVYASLKERGLIA